MSKDRRKYKDRADYLIKAVTKRRRQLKLRAVDYKGGKCFNCGYSNYEGALEFHHIDPKLKKFSLSTKGLTRSWERIVEELDKCVLVCSNCHKEIHAGKLQLSDEN